MTFNEIAFFVITILVSVIGYFLKTLHSEMQKLSEAQKKMIEEQYQLSNKIDLVEQEGNLRSSTIEQMTRIEIKHLSTQIAELTVSVKKLIEIQMKK
jgi:hypothetical protein